MANRAAGPLELLVIQATPFCNVDCTYCYLPNRSSKAKMSEATLERLFAVLLPSPLVSDELTVLWHAGEPLVLKPDYYARALEIIAAANTRGVRVNHSLQTNATLIDQSWIEFFRTHNIKVGVSLDGPRHLHDRHRRTRAGGGTFDQTMRGIRLLPRNALPFHVITVLSRESLSAADELFEFYVENGIRRVAFNIEEIEGRNNHSSLADADSAQVRAFFAAMFERVEKDPAQLEVREFIGALDVILRPQSASYGNPQADPLRLISVGVNGELSTFSPELLGYAHERYGSFAFGNLHDEAPLSFLSSANYRTVEGDIRRGVERCRQSCEYFDLCLGGAPANKLFENGSFDTTETIYCRLSKKAVIDVVLANVEREFGIANPVAA